MKNSINNSSASDSFPPPIIARPCHSNGPADRIRQESIVADRCRLHDRFKPLANFVKESLKRIGQGPPRIFELRGRRCTTFSEGNNHPTFALLVDPMLCMCSTRVFTPTHFSKFAGSEVRFRETLTAAPSSRKPGPTCADLSRAAVHSNAQRRTAMLSYERKLRWLCLSLQINLWRLQPAAGTASKKLWSRGYLQLASAAAACAIRRPSCG